MRIRLQVPGPPSKVTAAAGLPHVLTPPLAPSDSRLVSRSG
jgi:hypothetical protein